MLTQTFKLNLMDYSLLLGIHDVEESADEGARADRTMAVGEETETGGRVS